MPAVREGLLRVIAIVLAPEPANDPADQAPADSAKDQDRSIGLGDDRVSCAQKEADGQPDHPRRHPERVKLGSADDGSDDDADGKPIEKRPEEGGAFVGELQG